MNPAPSAAEFGSDSAPRATGATDAIAPDRHVSSPSAADEAPSGSDRADEDELGHIANDATPLRTIDLDAIDADLNAVEAALRRLDDGSYWHDEVTGAPIDPDTLAADPIRRRA